VVDLRRSDHQPEPDLGKAVEASRVLLHAPRPARATI
jgi:hypothetical protein